VINHIGEPLAANFLRDFLVGLLQAALIAAFTWLVLERHERKRKRQVSQLLGSQLGQLIYWIWFFQQEGRRVRNRLDHGEDVNRWVAAMIRDFRGQSKGAYLHDVVSAPVSAKKLCQMLGELPDALADWQWRANRMHCISETIFAILPVADAKIASRILEPITKMELVSVDLLYSLDAAVVGCRAVGKLASANLTIENPLQLSSLLRSIDSGIIGVWRVMYTDTAKIWDVLHVALREMPTELQQEHDRVIARLSYKMSEPPPLTTDPIPQPLHPRSD
jgi:hypothetical protein